MGGWKVPAPRDREAGVLYAQGLFGRADVEAARAVVMEGVRFGRVRECRMVRTYAGDPCSDWTCSACGKVHVHHNAALLGEYCCRCGAAVVEVVG